MLTIAAVNTVFLSLVPIVAALLLVIVCTLVLSFRAAKVADLKADVERQLEGTLQRDAQIARDFADSIISGVATEEAIARFQTERATMLPTANPEAPHLWTTEQLKNWRRHQLEQGVEQINRRMVASSVAVSVLIIAVAVVGMGALYHFESTTDSPPASADPRELPPAIPAPLPPNLSPAPLPTIPPTDQPAGSPPVEPQSVPDKDPSRIGKTATRLPHAERNVLL